MMQFEKEKRREDMKSKVAEQARKGIEINLKSVPVAQSPLHMLATSEESLAEQRHKATKEFAYT